MGNSVLSLQIKAITPPADLPKKTRAEEIIELPNYLKVVADIDDKFNLLYVSETEPDVSNRDKVWLKTTNHYGKEAGIYIYENGEWVNKARSTLAISSTEPITTNVLWIKVDENNQPLDIYFHNGNNWISLINKFSWGDTPDFDKTFWLNPNASETSEYGVIPLLKKEGTTFLNALNTAYNRGVFIDNSPPSEVVCKNTFATTEQKLETACNYPLWYNPTDNPEEGKPSGLYYRQYSLDANQNGWRRCEKYIFTKRYDNIIIPAGGSGSYSKITSYRSNGADLFYTAPLVFGVFYDISPKQAGIIPPYYLVRPSTNFEKSYVDVDYYNPNASTQLTISITLVAIGDVLIKEITP